MVGTFGERAEQVPFALVRAKNAQAVEDRGGVPQRPEHRDRAERGARETILEANRHLLHTVEAERGGNREELEIEGELLHEEQWKDLVDDTPVKDLQADLRIAHIETKEQPVQLLVPPARDPARAGIVHDRVRMSLRADDEVEILASRELEVERHRRGIEIEVCVDQRDPLAMRRERARLDRVALPSSGRSG